jgi:hypothetical protein
MALLTIDPNLRFPRSFMIYRRCTLFAMLVILILAGCGGSGQTQQEGHSPAAQAVESYLQALAGKDENAFSQWLCPDWEMDAFLEYDAYSGMETKLDQVSCNQTGSQDGTALVNCQGKILLSYGTEQQQVDLSPRTYRLIAQNGSWQVCGFSTPAP